MTRARLLPLVLALAVVACGRSRPPASPPGEPAGNATQRATSEPAEEAASAQGATGGGAPDDEQDDESHGGRATPLPARVTRLSATWSAALAKAGVQLPQSRSPTPRRPAADGALLLGRRGVWWRGARRLATRCGRGPCKGKKGGAAITLSPGDLGAPTAEGPRLIPRLPAPRKAGRPVLVLADARVTVQTVLQVLATLRTKGARPVVGAVGAGKGGAAELVAHWPDGAPRDPRLPSAPIRSDAAPQDTEGVTLELTAAAWTVVLQRTGGGYMRREVDPDPQVVARWAAAAARVGARHLLVAASPDLPWGDVLLAVDAALDPCGGSPCERGVKTLQSWSLISLDPDNAAGAVDPPAPPPAPTVRATPRPAATTGPVRPGLPARAMRGHGVDLDLRAPLPTKRERP